MPPVLRDFLDLYRHFAEYLQWTPRQVDRLEVAEAAALLGRSPWRQPAVAMARQVALAGDGRGGGAPSGGGPADSIGREAVAARVAAAKAGAPPPTW